MAQDPRTTAATIAENALRLIGARPPSMRAPNPFELRTSVSALDRICAHYAGKTEVPWLRRTYLIDLTADTPSYDLNTETEEGTIDVRHIERWRWATLIEVTSGRREPLDLVDEEEWRRIDRPVKSGRPEKVWIEHTLTPVMRVWRQPTEAGVYQLELIGQVEPRNLAGENGLGEVQIDLPQSWRLCLEYQLAAHIGSGPVRRLPFNRMREIKGDAMRLEAELMAHSKPESHEPRQIEPWGND